MADGDVIGIGGGVAGLSSGLYPKATAWDTAVFQMPSSPGGRCTSWDRGGYVFDGCLHWSRW